MLASCQFEETRKKQVVKMMITCIIEAAFIVRGVDEVKRACPAVLVPMPDLIGPCAEAGEIPFRIFRQQMPNHLCHLWL